MKNKFQYLIMAGMLMPAVFAGCTGDGVRPENPSGLTVRLYACGIDSGGGPEQETGDGYRIDNVTAYRFAEGYLQEIMAPVSQDGDRYMFRPETADGMLYVLANASGISALESIRPGLDEEEFLSMDAAVPDMTADGVLMSGSMRIDGSSGGLGLTRSAARLDVASRMKGVRVLSVSVTGLKDRGMIWPGRESPGVADGASEIHADWSGDPLENGRRFLSYIPEQDGGSVEARIVISSGEGTHRLRAVFPARLKRNTVYTLDVRGTGAAASVAVTDGDWAAGDVSGTSPVYGGLVDTGASQLPDGVRVSRTRDTVYIPHTRNVLSLAVLASPESELSVSGEVRGADVSVRKARASMEHVASVDISTEFRLPGSTTERMYVDVVTGGSLSGRIVIVFEANPVVFGGHLALDENGTCDFGKYIDGELGTVSMPAGMTLDIEYPDGESEWIRAEETVPAGEVSRNPAERVYRLTGGWKPNDPKADGRVQEARIVISGSDGTGSETYTVRRLNIGLPVVRIGQTWWAQYNLSGNAGDYADQITISENPAEGYDSLLDMLVSVPDDELLRYMGDQYQGGRLQGMPLAHDGNGFHYGGVTANPDNFGLIDPAIMAPDGYRIPGYDDFAFLVPGDDYNLGGTGTRSYVNRDGKMLTVNIVEREVNFLGQDYGPVAFYEFESEGSRLVLYGPGHQWNTVAGNVARMNILFATYGDSGRSWSLEGYSQNDRPGQNWLKYTVHNTVKTRTIRCVKTPVEYMYD